MSKRGRIANRARRAEVRDRARDLIPEALVAVGTWFENEAECVDGCSLLSAVLASLGISAHVQPVHTLAFFSPEIADDAGNRVLATSQRAIDFALANELGHPDWDWDSLRSRGDDGWAGHTVVVVDEPGLVLDPTFGQFTKLGFPDRVVYIKVDDPNSPPDGFWAVQPAEFDGRFLVHYIPENGDTEILDKASILTRSWQGVAGQFANHLRSGGTAANVPWSETWKQYKKLDTARDYTISPPTFARPMRQPTRPGS